MGREGLMRRIFWFLNKFFMVPLFRLGFGPFIGNPLTGYIMVLKVIGRKTGRVRYTPVNYALMDGRIYFLSGFRKVADWYRNLRAHPTLEVILPGGVVSGAAVEIDDPAVRLPAARRILKNAGFAGFFEGYNPFTISDAELLRKTADIPLLCIQPDGLGSGASDPGGWAWVGMPVSLLLFGGILWLLLR
jgi:deazaflavin-dependent oxidoreductase (nitroreductase family)